MDAEEHMLVQEIIKMPSKKFKIIFAEAENLILYSGEIRKYHLKEEEEIPEEVYRDIYYNVVGKRAKKRALYLLEKMDRTEKSLKDKLLQNGYPDKLAEEAVAYVKSYHYVDDLRYAKNYIRCYQTKKSAGKLKMDLLMKGIEKDTIQKALEEEFDRNETEMIHNILEKKGYFLKEPDLAEQRRMYQFLLRRGYRSADILQVMKCDDYLT